MHQDIKRILIVRTDRIGDVILTLPMAEVLIRHFPTAQVSMLIREYTSEIVGNSPFVNNVILIDDNNGQLPFFQLVRAVRRQHFDVVFHTHPMLRFALLTWLARIPTRVGTGFRWYSFLFNRKIYEHRKDARYHELEYNLHLLRAIGIPDEPTAVTPFIKVEDSLHNTMSSLLRDNGVAENDSIVILHPGSGGSARNWSVEKFGALARRLTAISRLQVIITGGKGEEEIVASVRDAAGSRVLTFVGIFSLLEYSALARHASLFIANSTGPLHIAAAVGTPVIGFYPQHTPLSEARWGPYTKNKIVFTPKNQPPKCVTCTRTRSQLCECMETISVDDVFEAASAALKSGMSAGNLPHHSLSENSQ